MATSLEQLVTNLLAAEPTTQMFFMAIGVLCVTGMALYTVILILKNRG